MTQYIVEKDGVRYGMFEGRSYAQRWAEYHIGGDARHIHAITDKSEAETPSLKVGDVVRAKDEGRRVGMPFYVPDGSEGVVTKHIASDHSDVVIVTFHASHPDTPDKDWTSQKVDRRDLTRANRSCSHL